MLPTVPRPKHVPRDSGSGKSQLDNHMAASRRKCEVIGAPRGGIHDNGSGAASACWSCPRCYVIRGSLQVDIISVCIETE